MNKIAHFWFTVGFGIITLLFTVLNFATYVKNAAELQARHEQGIYFSHDGVHWGFPLKMYIPSYGIDTPAFAINGIILLFVGWAVGIAFVILSDKLHYARKKDPEE